MLTNRKLARQTTVFTASDGTFEAPGLPAGTYDLRVRRPGYQGIEQLETKFNGKPLALTIAVETDPNELAWQLPANRWTPLMLAKLSSDEKREEFVRQCGYCHQQGNWATRVRRSKEDWENIFNRMERLGGVVSPALRAELPAAFNAGYDDNTSVAALTQPEFVPPPAPEGKVAKAVITEWAVGDPISMLHDIAVEHDGSIWAVDTNADRLLRLDPKTNQRKEYPIPTGKSEVGGIFHNSGFLQMPNAIAKVAPHSLQVAEDGTIWVTLCLGNKVGHLDPATGKWKIYEQKAPGVYPHTVRIDKKGRVWYTNAVSNHISMIDPKTDEMRVFTLPFPETKPSANTPKAVIGEGGSSPVPYGIDIAPDGAVWFSQLNAKRIGRLDPDTGEVKIVDTPFAGPRRLRFDSKGNLWIPGFSSNLIARYNLTTGEFKTWPMPTGGVDTPYALNVDRKTDTVWICGTASDTLVSFDPATERFTIYPLPTRVTYTREIDFGPDGAIWTSNSNFPGWHIGAAIPSVIRLQLPPS